MRDETIMNKYYITFPFDYKMGESVIEVSARNELEAICSISATVWTEEEWKEAQKVRWIKYTKAG